MRDHPSAAPRTGEPRSSEEQSGDGAVGNSSTDPGSVLAGKDPLWPRNHVLFLRILYHQRKIFNDIFFFLSPLLCSAH